MFDQRITVGDRKLLEEYLNGYDYKTSGLSFSALYMWRDINQFSWQMIGDYLCVAGISHLELEDGIILPFMFPPLTKNGRYDKKKLRETLWEAKRIFEAKNQEFNLRLVPFHMLELFRDACPGELEFLDDRPNYDYLYSVDDLIQLRGRKYHGKKGHLNYFRKNNDYEFIELTSDMAPQALAFIDEFNARKEIPPHEMELLEFEREAMADVFNHLEDVGYDANAITINGKIEAIAIGGDLNGHTVTEHIEKANVEYRGLYQAINYEFCKKIGKRATYINREEDMGIPNLRKAKLSYKPVELIEKYIIKCKPEKPYSDRKIK